MHINCFFGRKWFSPENILYSSNAHPVRTGSVPSPMLMISRRIIEKADQFPSESYGLGMSLSSHLVLFGNWPETGK